MGDRRYTLLVTKGNQNMRMEWWNVRLMCFESDHLDYLHSLLSSVAQSSFEHAS